jgi:hypothetical protein
VLDILVIDRIESGDTCTLGTSVGLVVENFEMGLRFMICETIYWGILNTWIPVRQHSSGLLYWDRKVYEEGRTRSITDRDLLLGFLAL